MDHIWIIYGLYMDYQNNEGGANVEQIWTKGINKKTITRTLEF